LSDRAIFLGSKAFGLAIFRTLAEAQPALSWTVLHPNDEQDARSVPDAFRKECAGRGVGFQVVSRAQDAYRIIEDAKPDIVFVCGWYFLLPASLLESGPRFFGIHNSLLPKYRGGAPLIWAMIRGEPEVGSTLFGIVPGMDDGPIYLQVSVEPGPDQGIGEVLAALEQRYLAALPLEWPEIVSGRNAGVPQDDAAATYCGQRRPEDGLIDWRQDASAVHNFVRAQSSPYPGAFTMTPLGKVVVRGTRPVAAPYFGTPGQVLERRAEEVIVACGGETAIAIAEASGPSGESALSDLFPSLSLRLAGGN
jgi:methionyl-tRNA formyltransferase